MAFPNIATVWWNVQSDGADGISAVSATITNGGSGYLVNDILTVSGGTFGAAATFQVSNISGGAVQSIILRNAGSYSAIPANPASTTGGSGTGCTLTITWSTSNGGGFDTAATGKATDLTTDANTANTASPVVSSASYNFVGGDAGKMLYVQGGTSWLAGWYPIASVASNKATLDAAIGHATLADGTLNTVVGCATVGTPTAGVWAIDYSRVGPAPFALTGLTSSAANAIILTASATVAMCGNAVLVTGGTNATTGTYIVTAVSAGVSLTVDRNWCSAAVTSGAAGTAGLGGALLTPLNACNTAAVGQNVILLKNGSYTTATAINLPAGAGGTPSVLKGYNTVPGDLDAVATFSNLPTIQASAAVICISQSNQIAHFYNLIIDENLKAASAILLNASSCLVDNVKAMNGNTNCIRLNASNCTASRCWATGTKTGGNAGIACTAGSGIVENCVSSANATPGFLLSAAGFTLLRCIALSNTGSSSDGFQVTTTSAILDGCIAYNNAGAGLNMTNANASISPAVRNCIFSQNTGPGTKSSADMTRLAQTFDYNAYYLNTGGARTNTPTGAHDLILSNNPFVAAGTDFRLNTLAGGGGACRAAGFPGVYPSLAATIGYLDIGAVQHQDPIMAPTIGGHVARRA